MADKSIDQLIAAENILATDLFVLQQSGIAKKLTGQVLLNWLTAAADGHGGIHSIAKLSTSGLTDTYRITLADTTYFDFVVTNGKSIQKIAKTKSSGLVDTYTISYNDNTTGTFTVTNGAKGDKGDNAYIWVKYASQKPTSSAVSLGDIPDDWIGIYTGTSATAPTSYSSYKWYQIKGEKGDTGDPAQLVSTSITYQVGSSGTIIPSGSWSPSVPVVPQGKYLWTRQEIQFNSGNPVISYTVARFGVDGTGSVSSVCNIGPDENGNVPLTAESLDALARTGGTMAGPINMNGQKISGLNAPTANEDAVNKKYVDAIDWFGTGLSIPSGSDLDTYRTPGKYCVTSSSISNTIVNSPVRSDNFALFVFRRTSSTSINQMIVTLNSAVYFRGCASDGDFRDWRRVLSDSDLDSIMADIEVIAESVKKAAPRNLLDNSYLRNPVNQRGQTSYSGQGYGIDRWKSRNEENVTTVNSGSVSCTKQLWQDIEPQKIKSNTPYTFTACQTDGTILCLCGQAGDEVHLDNEQGEHKLTIFFDDSPAVWLGAGEYIWAALYEGEYTIDTLPEYQPKGYGAELMECYRYFVNLGRCNMAAKDAWGFYYGDVRFPVEMRIAPTVTFRNPVTGTVNAIGKWDGNSFVDFTDVVVGTLYKNVCGLASSGGTLTAGTSYTAYVTVSADL